MEKALDFAVVLVLCVFIIGLACPVNCTCQYKRRPERVKCRGPSVVEFPSDISTKIEILEFSATNLSSMPKDGLSKLVNLKKITFSSNPKLRSLPAGIFDNLLQLQTIVINYHNFSTFPDRLFNNLPKVSRIYLKKNGLITLPSTTFRNLPSLELIDLENNQLISLPENLFDNSLPKLSTLGLDRNRLKTLPDNVFVPVSNSLTSLFLDTNYFNFLPMRALRTIKNLEEIKVHRNPLYCNCSLAEFAIWAKDIIHNGGVSCDGVSTPLDQLNLTHCEMLITTSIPSTTTLPLTSASTSITSSTTFSPVITSTPKTSTQATTSVPTSGPTTTSKFTPKTSIPTTLPTPTTHTKRIKMTTSKTTSISEPETSTPSQETSPSRVTSPNGNLSSAPDEERTSVNDKTSTPTVVPGTESKVPNKGDSEEQDTSDENAKRKTVIIAISLSVVGVIILLALVFCLLHTGILSPRCGMRFQREKVVLYDAEGNVLMKDGEVIR